MTKTNPTVLSTSQPAEIATMRRYVKAARGAIESGQVIDKDVHGTLTKVIEMLDALAATPAQEGEIEELCDIIKAKDAQLFVAEQEIKHLQEAATPALGGEREALLAAQSALNNPLNMELRDRAFRAINLAIFAQPVAVGGEREDLLGLADEIERARILYLNQFGTPNAEPLRDKLAQLLWDNKGTFATALRQAAQPAVGGEPLAWRVDGKYGARLYYTTEWLQFHATQGDTITPLYAAQPASQPAVGGEALGYATRLLEHFVAEHFPHNPDWKPLPDLIGVLTQIDNAITIARDYKARLAALPASPLRGRELLEAALKHIDFDGMDPNTFTIAELRRAL